MPYIVEAIFPIVLIALKICSFNFDRARIDDQILF